MLDRHLATTLEHAWGVLRDDPELFAANAPAGIDAADWHTRLFPAAESAQVRFRTGYGDDQPKLPMVVVENRGVSPVTGTLGGEVHLYRENVAIRTAAGSRDTVRVLSEVISRLAHASAGWLEGEPPDGFGYAGLTLSGLGGILPDAELTERHGGPVYTRDMNVSAWSVATNAPIATEQGLPVPPKVFAADQTVDGVPGQVTMGDMVAEPFPDDPPQALEP